MDKNLRRELILDNFNNPMNKHTGDESYFMINTNNESCIDNLDIYYKINDGKIVKNGMILLRTIFKVSLKIWEFLNCSRSITNSHIRNEEIKRGFT